MYRTRTALSAGHIKLRADRGSDDSSDDVPDAVLNLLPLFGFASISSAPASMVAVGLCGALNRTPSMLVAVGGKASTLVSMSELCLWLCVEDGGSRGRIKC